MRPRNPALSVLSHLMIALALALLATSPSMATPPPPSPGITVGHSTYDLQRNHSMGNQVARLPGTDCVHFVWTGMYGFPTDPFGPQRSFWYNSYTISSGTLNQGPEGHDNCSWQWGCTGDPGHIEVAVDGDNLAHIAVHQRNDPSFPFHPWHLFMPVACNGLHVDDELSGVPGAADVLWPRIDVQVRSAGQDVIHEIASETDTLFRPQHIYYWRNTGGVWSGPVLVDSSSTIGYVVTADANSDRCAIVLHANREAQLNGAYNIAYYESFTAGAGWLDQTELGDANKHMITNYSTPGGPQAWRHISAVYDNDGILNVIWDERQDSITTATIIRHWNSARGTIRPVASALWSNRQASGYGTDLSLAKLTLGVGDGATTCGGQPNQNYLYVLYTRFGGPTEAEQADSSVSGFMNGELYLNVSTDGGFTWSPPTNLTNTKTPNCNPGIADTSTGIPTNPDSVCRSEHWASLNKVVHDIDIFFVSDLDPGSAPHGEGTWQFDPMFYLRLPGVTADAQFVCPSSGPQFVAAYQLQQPGSCGAHGSANDTISGLLTISNPGNAPLLGEINVVYTNPPTPPELWLNVKGRQTYPFSLAAGDPDSNLGVRMYPRGLASGSYQAELRITHNDPSQPSPTVYPITLNVDACACHANPICDAAIDVLDVTAVIEHAFRGGSKTDDPFCPSPIAGAIDGTTDVNCSGETNILDVVVMIGVAFRGRPQTDFCDPCTQPGF